MEEKTFSAIGSVARRKDGISKVTGREIYSSDVSLPNMLHARVLRSQPSVPLSAVAVWRRC